MSKRAAEELATLAEKLGLSEKQRRFAEALAIDPDRNQTKAALNAGYATTSAYARGAELVKNREVMNYMEAFIQTAKGVAVDTVAETQEAVMETAEVMLRLSRQGRADIGKHLKIDEDGNWLVRLDPKETAAIRHVKTRSGADKDGMPWTEAEIKVADPVPALQSLARIYGLEKESDSGKVVNINIEKLLQVVSPEQLRAANMRLLSGEAEGDAYESQSVTPVTRDRG